MSRSDCVPRPSRTAPRVSDLPRVRRTRGEPAESTGSRPRPGSESSIHQGAPTPRIAMAHPPGALCDDAAAVLAGAESLSRREFGGAVSEAAEIGIRLRTVAVSELSNDRYVANPTNRCYFCRTELGAALKPIAAETGSRAIADGVNVSDLGGHRPGIQA